MSDFDVIVVGGGPAGTTAAISCSSLGLNVLLVERGNVDGHKPCGGVLPPISAEVISDALGRKIPQRVMSSPSSLGLYYMPPSGKENGGTVRNYRLLNVNRDLFDRWLREVAEEEGVQIWYETSFMGFKREEPIQVELAGKDGSPIRGTTRYLIGADGVHSRVRRQLYGTEHEILYVPQEHLEADGDFEDCFYACFRGAVSPTYGYLIPKDDLFVVGAGFTKPLPDPFSACLDPFKEWLAEEFAFQQGAVKRREVWAIPYGFVCKGVGDVILVGDAAGLCNSLSGEGVRHAIRSGEIAGASIREAMTIGETLAAVYKDNIDPLARLIRKTHDLTLNLTDEGREEFVKTELKRVSLS